MEATQATETETDLQRDDRELLALAEVLKRSEGYKVLLKRLKDDVMRKWAGEQKPDQREQHWHALQAVGALENRINAVVDNARSVRRIGT